MVKNLTKWKVCYVSYAKLPFDELVYKHILLSSVHKV